MKWKVSKMIEVENLSKRYGEKLAVDGVSFVVQPGIVTGFLGPNGAGKSTTMRMIAGLDEPTAGRVVVNGRRYRSSRAPMGAVEEFVDRPLVVRVLSVLERSDPPVGSDQEIRRKPEAASGGLDRSERAALGAAVPEHAGLTGHRRAQSTRAQQRAQSALDAEPPVQLPFRIGDQRERQVGLCLASSAAVEWKTTTSRMPWERISSWRMTIERR
jgi:ABC-type cobalamin/Fe3+-siderophores transport system ATPase subunit